MKHGKKTSSGGKNFQPHKQKNSCGESGDAVLEVVYVEVLPKYRINALTRFSVRVI